MKKKHQTKNKKEKQMEMQVGKLIEQLSSLKAENKIDIVCHLLSDTKMDITDIRREVEDYKDSLEFVKEKARKLENKVQARDIMKKILPFLSSIENYVIDSTDLQKIKKNISERFKELDDSLSEIGIHIRAHKRGDKISHEEGIKIIPEPTDNPDLNRQVKKCHKMGCDIDGDTPIFEEIDIYVCKQQTKNEVKYNEDISMLSGDGSKTCNKKSHCKNCVTKNNIVPHTYGFYCPRCIDGKWEDDWIYNLLFKETSSREEKIEMGSMELRLPYTLCKEHTFTVYESDCGQPDSEDSNWMRLDQNKNRNVMEVTFDIAEQNPTKDCWLKFFLGFYINGDLEFTVKDENGRVLITKRKPIQ